MNEMNMNAIRHKSYCKSNNTLYRYVNKSILKNNDIKKDGTLIHSLHKRRKKLCQI